MINWDIINMVLEYSSKLNETIRYYLNTHWNYLTEAAHVNYRMDSVSDTISTYIENTEKDEVIYNEYMDSTWFFDSETLSCYNSKRANPSTMHKILFRFINSKKIKSGGFIEDRSVIMTKNDDMKITVNLHDYLDVLYDKENPERDEALDRIANSVDHELQHGFDEYFMVNKNWLETPKHTMHKDLCATVHEFNNVLSFADIQWLKDMTYFLGKDEQRAMFKATSRFLEKDMKNLDNSNTYRELINLKIIYSYHNIEFNSDEKTFVLAALRTFQVQSFSRMILFKAFVEEFRDDKIRRNASNYNYVPSLSQLSVERDITRIRAVILGYYMFKHELLVFKTHKPLNVGHFFSDENIHKLFDKSKTFMQIVDDVNNVEFIRDYVNCVKMSAYIIYTRYEKLIYNECERNLKLNLDKSLGLFQTIERTVHPEVDMKYLVIGGPQYNWLKY